MLSQFYGETFNFYFDYSQTFITVIFTNANTTKKGKARKAGAGYAVQVLRTMYDMLWCNTNGTQLYLAGTVSTANPPATKAT